MTALIDRPILKNVHFFCFCIYILRGAVKFRVEQLFQENDIVLKSLLAPGDLLNAYNANPFCLG